MANKQSRRSVSLEAKLHDVTQERAKVLGISMSEHISTLIRADLVRAGIEPPPAKHSGHGFYKHGEGRQAKARAAQEDAARAKYDQALAFQREKLAEPKTEVAPATDKANECWWCGVRFLPVDIPTEDKDGNKLHGRCKREIARLPPGECASVTDPVKR